MARRIKRRSRVFKEFSIYVMRNKLDQTRSRILIKRADKFLRKTVASQNRFIQSELLWELKFAKGQVFIKSYEAKRYAQHFTDAEKDRFMQYERQYFGMRNRTLKEMKNKTAPISLMTGVRNSIRKEKAVELNAD